VDAVLEGRALGGIFEGQAAIRAFVEDWWGMYEELEYKLEEVHDLGNGVVFAVVLQEARPTGIAGHVRQREGWVYVWVGGLIARLSIPDIDEARAAAERLAQERGWAMSATECLCLEGSGKGSGAPVDTQYVGIFDFRGDRIRRFRVYPDRAEGLRAAGLSE
jgi:ketosteroid isomerase-like protein